MKPFLTAFRYSVVSALLLIALNGCKKPEPGNFDPNLTSYAKLPYTTPLDAVKWTDGFWHEYMLRLRDIYLPGTIDGSYMSLWNGASFRNFLRAAGMEEGGAVGRIWADGDCYLILDAVTRAYAYQPDDYLKNRLDFYVDLIPKIQDDKGRIDTWNTLKDFDARTAKAWQIFEGNREKRGKISGWDGYNLAHLHLFATTYHQVFGDDQFLEVADKALLYLMYHDSVSIVDDVELPHFSTPPLELYKRTGDESHLQWMQDIYAKNTVFGPPLRDAEEIFGHNTATSHTLIGGAMLYELTGEEAILNALNRLAENLLAKKVYITGAVAPVNKVMRPEITVKGITYQPANMGEAVGEAFDLPNEASYCESCGQCLFMEWFYHMFRLTGNAVYMDACERMLYNATTGTVELDEPNFFYCNPQEQLATSIRYDNNDAIIGYRVNTTWKRVYTQKCSCCPPKVMRAIAMTPQMAYDVNAEGLWVNIYGSNTFSSGLPWGGNLECIQTSNYPWDGKVKIEITAANSTQPFKVLLRIPGWVNSPVSISLNGETAENAAQSGSYFSLDREWKTGDIIEMEFPMPVRVMAADPRIRENIGKVSVMRGPVVYCLENEDIPEGVDLTSLYITSDANLQPEYTSELGGIVKLNGSLIQSTKGIKTYDAAGNFTPDMALYQETSLPAKVTTLAGDKPVQISLIPYNTRLNRDGNYFRVWLPVYNN
jgi:uncharacterized protein